MKVLPLMVGMTGLNSMATLVSDGRTRILIDPGVALPTGSIEPTPAERHALTTARAHLLRAAAGVDAVFVTLLDEARFSLLPDLPAGVPVYLPSPATVAQYQAFQHLLAALGGATRPLALGTGARLTFGAITVECSPAQPFRPASGSEGEMAVTVRAGGRTFVHAPDICGCGPEAASALDYVASQRPDLLYTTAAHEEWPCQRQETSVANLLDLVRRTGCRIVLARAGGATGGLPACYSPLLATGRICTPAMFLGQPEPIAATPTEAVAAVH